MKHILFIFTILLFSSCVTNRAEDVEFFINKDKNIQYFFPSTWWNTDNKQIKFEADILYKDYITDDTENGAYSIINFTIHSSTILFRNNPEKFLLYNEKYNLLIPTNQIEIIYIDKDKTRFTSRVKSSDLDELFRNTNNVINISLHFDKNYNLRSKDSFIKHINYFKSVILGIK